MEETRLCNDCGEEWMDTGAFECPFCGSSNTHIVKNDDNSERVHRDTERAIKRMQKAIAIAEVGKKPKDKQKGKT